MKYILASSILLSSALYAADLSSIEHGLNTTGGYQVVFKNVDILPTAFNTDNPATIVLDFMGATSSIAGREVNINSNGIYDVDILQGQGKTRAVVNLAAPVGYNVSLNGKDAVLRVNSSGTGSNVNDAVGASAGTSNAFMGFSNAQSSTGGNRQVAQIRAGKPLSTQVGATNANKPETISPIFRRGPNKNGTLSFTLPNPDTVVNVHTEGTKVVAEIPGFKIANKEQKRLDVADYATPVKFADIQRTTKGSKVTLDMGTNPFEFVTYQTGSTFTIEVMPPAPDELTRKTQELQGFSSTKVYKGEPLSLNFQDIEVRAVLQIIAEFTKNNIVVSDSVTGNITLRLDNVPWDQALDIILKTKGLDKRENNGVIYVAPAQELNDSEIAQLQGYQDKQRLMPARTELIQVKYARAEDLKTIIEASRSTGDDKFNSEDSILSQKGTVSVDQRTNSLLVSDVPTKIQGIRDLVAKLDEPVRQVLVDARLVLTRDEFAKDIGVRFGASFVGNNKNGNDIVGGSGSLAGADSIRKSGDVSSADLSNRLGVNLPAAPKNGSAASYGIAILASDFLVDLELSALQTEGQIEIVSSPRVVTQDGAKARVASGTKVPQITVSDNTATVTYESAELALDVTPRIAPNNMVDMQLEITNNQPGNVLTIGNNTVFPINTNELNTNVLVDNGETIVLGGVYEQTQEVTTSKVPLLGDLPIVGNAFKNKQNKFNKSELLIFVTPRIIDKRLVENDKFSNLRE